MLPIISPPAWIAGFTKGFNLSHHQHKHISRYLTGLIASRTKTVTGMNSMFVDSLSSRSMNRFLTESGADINTQRILELQKHNETRWSKHGVAILDDTLVHKTGKGIPHAYKFYDHAEKRFVLAQCITTLHYADSKTSYALDYRVYAKKGGEGFRTKIELGMELIGQAIDMGLPAQTVVMDSWYICDDMVRMIESRGKFYIGACRSNLLVRVKDNRYVCLGEYVQSIPNFHEFEVNGKKLLVHTRKVHFRSIGDSRLIVSKHGKGIICLATNRKDHATKVLSDYMMRWKIEDFYRDAKQHLGLEKCQLRDIEGIKRHWYLVFLAHSVLKLGVAESAFGESLVRSSIGQKVKGVCMELLERFVMWVVEGGKSVGEVRDILGWLINRQS